MEKQQFINTVTTSSEGERIQFVSGGLKDINGWWSITDSVSELYCMVNIVFSLHKTNYTQ